MLATLRTKNRWDVLFIILLIPLSLWYWAGVPGIPFHPDESTFLYMSADWETLLTHPNDLAWQPDSSNPGQTLRLLDAPLGRYLAGAARWMAGIPTSASDWSWSASWEQNRQAGALPGPALLLAGRMGQAVLFPFSLLFIYLTGVKLNGRFLGWSAALLLGLNAIFLLHTRRAQAESGLVFAITLTLLCLACCQKRPWLIAIPAALAFCAKQSALPLMIAGLAAIWVYRSKPVSLHGLGKALGLYLALYAGVVLILNPFLWAHPVEAGQAAITARQELLARQTLEYGQLAPDLILNSPGKAAFSMLANLFIVPPSIAEAGNYLDQTRLSADAYLSYPLHQLFRSLMGGGLLLTLCLVGCACAGRAILKPGNPHRGQIALIGLAGLLLFLGLSLTITLPFQRYVIPLVPFTVLSIAYGLDQVVLVLRHARRFVNRPRSVDL